MLHIYLSSQLYLLIFLIISLIIVAHRAAKSPGKLTSLLAKHGGFRLRSNYSSGQYQISANTKVASDLSTNQQSIYDYSQQDSSDQQIQFNSLLGRIIIRFDKSSKNDEDVTK